MNYLQNLAIAFDQLLNALRGGSADETLSSAAHRQRVKGHRIWGWTANAIDWLFFWQSGHCEQSWRAEVERSQLHPSFRLPDPPEQSGHHPV